MSQTIVQPYLFFNGRCEEALEFYRQAVGATIEFVARFKDSPEPPKPGMLPPGFENKIMHATFRIGDTALMASDGHETGLKFQGFSLSIAVATAAETDPLFNGLATGGKVTVPLAKTFWSPRFGMLVDKFGVGWMVSVATKKPQHF